MDQFNEIPDQSAIVSCLWDVLSNSWKPKGPQPPYKMAIMMPSNPSFIIADPPPVEYYDRIMLNSNPHFNGAIATEVKSRNEPLDNKTENQKKR